MRDAPTKGSGLAWVGRSIRRVGGSGAADRPRPLHRRPVGGASGPFRAQFRCRGPHRKNYHARQRDRIHRRRPCRGEADRPALHKFGYVPVAQPVLGLGCRAICRRTDRRGGRRQRGASRRCRGSACRSRSAKTAPVVDARAALADGAPQVHAEAARNVVVEGKMETPGFNAARKAAHRDRHDRGALATPERHADRRRARAMPRSIRLPAASR